MEIQSSIQAVLTFFLILLTGAFIYTSDKSVENVTTKPVITSHVIVATVVLKKDTVKIPFKLQGKPYYDINDAITVRFINDTAIIINNRLTTLDGIATYKGVVVKIVE